MYGSGTSSNMGVRAVFGLLGLAGGIYAGWTAYDRTGSIVLAIYVGLLLANYIGRGIGDIITDPQKVRRFLFFTLPVLFAAGGLAGAYALWGIWWVAVIVSFVAYFVGSFVVIVLFPRIALEEDADSRSRMGGRQPSPPSPSPGTTYTDPSSGFGQPPAPPSPPSPYDNVKRP